MLCGAGYTITTPTLIFLGGFLHFFVPIETGKNTLQLNHLTD